MTEQDQPDRAEPTGEITGGTLFAEETVNPETGEHAEVAEVISGSVFIPKAWRAELGLEQ